MSEPTSRQVEEPGRPDGLFVLIAGLYVAAMVGPAAVAVARRLVSEAATLYGVLLAAATGGVVVGALAVRRRDGVAERLGTTGLAWLLVAGPLAALAAVLGVGSAVDGVLAEGDVLLSVFAGFGAATVGFVLVSMAKTRYAAWRLADAAVEATWSAPWPRRSRRRVWYLAGLAAGIGAIAFVVGAYLGYDSLRIGGQLLVPAGAVLATVGRELTYRATNRGLEIRTPAARRFVPWSAFAGYRLSADSLALVRRERHRQSIRCDRSAIEDPAAVTAALESHLDRLS